MDDGGKVKAMRKWGLGAAVAAVLMLTGCGGTDDSSDDQAKSEPSQSSSSAKSKPSPKEESPEVWADDIEKDLLSVLGIKKFSGACPDIDWACTITDVSSTQIGTLNVTEQLTDISKEDAEKWAVNILNGVGPDHEDLDWVVIYDASGTVAGQAQRSDSPMLS